MTEFTTPIVFTALIGQYERLIEQPLAQSSVCRFICFTDDPALQSDTWEVITIPPRFPWDPTRSAREVKIAIPEIVRMAPASLWIDNRVILKVAPEMLLELLLSSADIALPLHSFRATVRDEFAAILRHGFDRPERVREQLHYMELYAPAILEQIPYWTAILARRHTDEVYDAMTSWFYQVLRHSRRDQLSVNWALSSSGLRVESFTLNNFESAFHDWAIVEKNPIILRDQGFSYSLISICLDRLQQGLVRSHFRSAANRFVSRLGIRR